MIHLGIFLSIIRQSIINLILVIKQLLFDSTLYGVIVCDNVIVDYRNLFDFEYWNALNLREYDFSKYEFYIFIEFDIPIEILILITILYF